MHIHHAKGQGRTHHCIVQRLLQLLGAFLHGAGGGTGQVQLLLGILHQDEIASEAVSQRGQSRTHLKPLDQFRALVHDGFQLLHQFFIRQLFVRCTDPRGGEGHLKHTISEALQLQETRDSGMKEALW